MPFNGAGSYSRSNGVNSGTTTWDLDRLAGTKITSARHDTHDNDIATALSTCVCKDGQSTISADMPFAGFKLLNIGEGTARTSAARISQVQDNALMWGGTTGGTANAQTCNLSPAITAYVSGMRVAFRAGATNTAAMTLNVNGVGAKAVHTSADADLKAGFLRINQLYEAIYHSSFNSGAGGWILVSGNPEGFIAYSPSYGISAGGFVLGTENYRAWQFIAENLIQVDLDFGATLSAGPGTTVTATLPFTALTRGVDQVGIGSANTVAGLPQQCQCYVASGSATLNILNYDARNWAALVFDHIRARIIYEI